MLTWEQWQAKAVSSLQASRILLENQKPVEAASRAYYAAYQMVTGVLIKHRLNPRTEQGNWSHLDTQEMYRIHICQNASLGSKEQNALRSMLLKFRYLLESRVLSDYGDAITINASAAKAHWRDASRLINFLNRLVQRGVL